LTSKSAASVLLRSSGVCVTTSDKSSDRSASQSSTRSDTACARSSPLTSAAVVRLAVAIVVSSTARTLINGNETSNITMTRR
jgi:hypothetical protein